MAAADLGGQTSCPGRRSSSTTRRRSRRPSCARGRGGSKREQGELGLIVIDYLQLMQAPGDGENRATEISAISRSLKALAKELNCAGDRAVAAQPQPRAAAEQAPGDVGPARIGQPSSRTRTSSSSSTATRSTTRTAPTRASPRSSSASSATAPSARCAWPSSASTPSSRTTSTTCTAAGTDDPGPAPLRLGGTSRSDARTDPTGRDQPRRAAPQPGLRAHGCPAQPRHGGDQGERLRSRPAARRDCAARRGRTRGRAGGRGRAAARRRIADAHRGARGLLRRPGARSRPSDGTSTWCFTSRTNSACCSSRASPTPRAAGSRSTAACIGWA